MATASHDDGMAGPVFGREEQGQNEGFILNGSEEQEGVNKFELKDENSENYDKSDAEVDRHSDILHTDYLRLQDEHKSLQQQNNKLQLLLAEYFQHIKCESRFSDDCTDEEKERCYHNNLAKLKELPEEAVDQKEHFEEQLKKVQEERQKIEDILETEMETFVVYKREVILRAMKRHGGKCVSLEALQKLKREISSKTHTLIQMKKNQEFVKAENLVKRCSLMKLEAQVKENKEARKKLKQSRDSKRLDVQCLQRKSGLLSNMDLLRDFEEHSDSIDALKEKLDQLKMRYTQLTQ
uniref:cilia- and flagella-associated protein 184-like isoform X3 n=1 Tax=Myxine glutinosa TaxID=7769 RepID=UPI00358E9C16